MYTFFLYIWLDFWQLNFESSYFLGFNKRSRYENFQTWLAPFHAEAQIELMWDQAGAAQGEVSWAKLKKNLDMIRMHEP
jgi:hypothetical protein